MNLLSMLKNNIKLDLEIFSSCVHMYMVFLIC